MLRNDAVKHAFRRFNAAKCATRARHTRTISWRAHGAPHFAALKQLNARLTVSPRNVSNMLLTDVFKR
eukprot:1390729-Lingulodinium_polyedra.AAC.1